MKQFAHFVLPAFLVLCIACPAGAQVSSTANGGAGGAGGSAAGGTATGGTSTNSNTTTGGAANIGSATSNYQGADVSVNYITPAGAAGVNGLAPGVDPTNNHLVTDANIRTSGTTKIKNTPDVNLGGPASGVCNGLSGGVGVGIPGLAVGGNISTVDRGCEARETARVAAMLGRMDVANAILENMDVVVVAMKAKNERDAREANQANAAQAQIQQAQVANVALAQAVQQQAARDREAEAMRTQQQAGIDALARQATMAKVNDTLTFTGKLTQGEEKTPQQLMAEDLAAKQRTAEKDQAAVGVSADAKSAAPLATPAAATVTGDQPGDAPQMRRAAAPTPTTSDDRPLRAPVLALVSSAKAEATTAKTDVVRSSPPQRREATEKKQASGPIEKVDPQAAMRFALGLSD